MDQKVMEKLKKLLALAGSPNEHEAALAMSRAEEIMRRHNITLMDVAQDGSGAEVAHAVIAPLGKTVTPWERTLATSVALSFNGRAIATRGLARRGFSALTFVASRTELEIILDLFERLRWTVDRMTKGYGKQQASGPYLVSTRDLTRSYRLGMVATIWRRLRTMQENSQPEEATNIHGLSVRDLVLVKDRAIEDRVSDLFGKTVNEKKRATRVVTSAYQDGQRDGHTVSLHRSVRGDGRGPAMLGQ